MNSPGGRSPRSGCCHRTSASTVSKVAVVERHDRLVVKPQLSGLQRLAERLLDPDALEGPDANLLVKDLPISCAALLGPVHGDVRVAKQILHLSMVCARERNTDARGHDVFLALEGEGAEQRLLDSLRHPHRVALRSEVLAENDELVPAEASEGELVAETRDRVGRSQGGLQSGRDVSEERVPGAVAEGVVYVLEPVEVQEQQGGEGSVALGARQRKLETVAKQGSIRQPGQGVVRGLVSQLLPRADSLNRAPKVPAYLSHHLEQADIGRDRRCR